MAHCMNLIIMKIDGQIHCMQFSTPLIWIGPTYQECWYFT